MDFLAIDIGGANIKTADGQGHAASYPFPLWKMPRQLPQQLRTAIAEAPASDHLVVTMTGELADCFPTKSDGVRFILDSTAAAADGRHTRVYLTSGMMVTPQVAKSRPLETAAANWHALARFTARYAPTGVGLLMDIGSTSCDLIPLVEGEVQAVGRDDTNRLLTGELLFSGVERSPICALLQSVQYRGQPCPVAHEVFATMKDAYLLLGDLTETTVDTDTADGRPATKANARGRMARMICADAAQFNHRDAVSMARAAADAQLKLVSRAFDQIVRRLPDLPETIIVSGHGEFLARRVIEKANLMTVTTSLTKELGANISRCASAHALAVLAREMAGLT